MVYITYC